MEDSVNYFKRWEEKVKDGTFNPATWQRKKRQLVHPDRHWLAENANMPVLDAGCGTAVDSNFFEQYVGLDVTPSFIHEARRRGVGNLILGDARHLPIRDKAFMTSYCKDLLLHLSFKDALKVLLELLRVGMKTFVAWGFEYLKSGTLIYTPIQPRKMPMKFIRKNKPRGMHNYKDGEVYMMNPRHATYPWFEPVGEDITVESDQLVMRRDFWHNRFSRKKLNRYCNIGGVIKGTSITEVREK